MESNPPIKKIVIGAVSFLLLVIIISTSFGTIGAGQRGIKTRFGKVVGILDTGLYMKNPLTTQVKKVDVQTQKEQAEATAASSDLQTVNTKVAVNYNLDVNKLQDLYTKIGLEYKSKIIDPAIQEEVKAVTAKYTAEQLITKRQEVTDAIKLGLTTRLAENDIQVTGVSIVNFDFSGAFNEAIERKVTAEQNALAAKNKLDQVKFEADQTIETAKAQAESIKIQAQAINSQGGADYVQLQAIKQWDGHLPTQMVPGSTVPFINLKN